MLKIQAEQEINGYVCGSRCISQLKDGEISSFKMWILKDEEEVFSRTMKDVTAEQFIIYYRQKVKEFTGHDEVEPIEEI